MADEFQNTELNKHGRFLYLGATKGWKDGTPILYWNVYFLDAPNDGEPLKHKANRNNLFLGSKGKELFPSFLPGSVIEMDYRSKEDDEVATIVSRSAKFIGIWENKEDVQQWRIAARAVELEFKLLKKQDKNKFDTTPLIEYHNAYVKMDRTQKTLFLSEIIRFITMGS